MRTRMQALYQERMGGMRPAMNPMGPQQGGSAGQQGGAGGMLGRGGMMGGGGLLGGRGRRGARQGPIHRLVGGARNSFQVNKLFVQNQHNGCRDLFVWCCCTWDWPTILKSLLNTAQTTPAFPPPPPPPPAPTLGNLAGLFTLWQAAALSKYWLSSNLKRSATIV